MVSGKKYLEKEKLVNKSKFYSVAEAIQLLKQTARTKFDETVDLAMKLGVDPKKDSIRGTVMLPGGSGKTKKVAVIAKAEKVKEAEAAGADLVGSEDLVDKIMKGFVGFDVLIATPDMMAAVGKLGKVLGPKGLMPNPKSGSVTFDIAKTVKEFRGGKVEFRMDKGAALHMILGKVSFEPKMLESNFNTALSSILTAKPSGFKGNYVQSITVSTTMGPGIKIDPKIVMENPGAEE
jgi:large subunit ribosomal protein L1